MYSASRDKCALPLGFVYSQLLNLHLYQPHADYKGLLWIIPREQEEKLSSEEGRGMAVIQQARHRTGH